MADYEPLGQKGIPNEGEHYTSSRIAIILSQNVSLELRLSWDKNSKVGFHSEQKTDSSAESSLG